MNTFLISLRVTFFSLVLTGILYPFAVTGIGKLLFPRQASGSILFDQRTLKPRGSIFIGQPFRHPAYFQPRPSQAGTGYDPLTSGGPNFAPTSQKLRDRVEREIARLKRENPDSPVPIPLDLVTASASGLDPHLSPEGALWQIPRIARARNVSQERIRKVVQLNTQRKILGFLGEERVSVVRLNAALDRLFGRPAL